MRIVLIHAVAAAVEPIADAFAQAWPEANLVNLLDDSLSPDRAREKRLSQDMEKRISGLADYAVSIGARGILYTCSAFGPAIKKTSRRLEIPVLRPNEAMFENALQCGNRVHMLATFQPSIESMEEEFRALANERNISATMTTTYVPDALDALITGNAKLHNELIGDYAKRSPPCDCLVLAHFSTSRALEAASKVSSVPVLTSPMSAVMKLRMVLNHAS